MSRRSDASSRLMSDVEVTGYTDPGRCRGGYQIPNWDCLLYVVTDRLTLIGIVYMYRSLPSGIRLICSHISFRDMSAQSWPLYGLALRSHVFIWMYFAQSCTLIG